jgi:tRNA-specific 2-thiouridylase
MTKKVALGMSGGVDSSVCAHLLQEQGYQVTGVYLECWRAPGCRTEEDRQDALKVALSLDIPFQVLDFKQTYKDKVVEYFFQEYQAGRTPNPDVMCNKEIKFGLFYDWAMEQGFDYVATGHYADLVIGNGPTQLAIPTDQHKDQTYFLYLLRANQLDQIIFPLAGYTKDQIRQAATQRSIHVASKKDSVGICFIGDINVKQFLKDRLGENPGQVIDTQGNVIGSHQGLWFYTIGQRHGFQIDKKTLVAQQDGSVVEKQNIPPFYVVAKKAETNQLVVGFGPDAYRQQFYLNQLHLINHDLAWLLQQPELLVRIRHTGQLLAATLKKEDNRLQLSLKQPAKGVAEGQAAVLYLPIKGKMICAGGGIIAT